MSFSKDFLTNVFPAVLARHPEITRGTNIKYKIVIRDVGKWMVDMTVTPARVYETEEWG